MTKVACTDDRENGSADDVRLCSAARSPPAQDQEKRQADGPFACHLDLAVQA